MSEMTPFLDPDFVFIEELTTENLINKYPTEVFSKCCKEYKSSNNIAVRNI